MTESIQGLDSGKLIVLSCGKDFIYLLLLLHRYPQLQTEPKTKLVMLPLILLLCHLKLTFLVLLIFLQILSWPSCPMSMLLHILMQVFPYPGKLSEIQIGQIIFDMSSSMKVSDLKPHTVELAQFIVNESSSGFTCPYFPEFVATTLTQPFPCLTPIALLCTNFCPVMMHFLCTHVITPPTVFLQCL